MNTILPDYPLVSCRLYDEAFVNVFSTGYGGLHKTRRESALVVRRHNLHPLYRIRILRKHQPKDPTQ